MTWNDRTKAKHETGHEVWKDVARLLKKTISKFQYGAECERYIFKKETEKSLNKRM